MIEASNHPSIQDGGPLVSSFLKNAGKPFSGVNRAPNQILEAFWAANVVSIKPFTTGGKK
jgi:hypothetical protein